MHPSGHFRRFKGYDYERGAAMFISFNVEPKCRVLGSIDGNGVLTLNEYGRIVEEKLLESAAQYDDRIRLHSHIVMPNHVHLRIYIRPGQKDALAVLARMILSIKMSTRMTVNRHGFPAFAWERQYHDILCLSQESINAADRYIALNPPEIRPAGQRRNGRRRTGDKPAAWRWLRMVASRGRN